MARAFGDCGSNNILALVKERLAKMFAPSVIDFVEYADAEYAINFTKNIQPASAVKVIKTWLNGWATSDRMHEEVILPCLFGCSGKNDVLNHYLQCPHLFALCNYLFKVDSCPLIRIGFKNPSIHNLKVTACVFTAYHVMKAQVRNGLLEGMHKDTRTTHAAWSVFANALEAEAGEHRISYTVFSLPKFISFLVSGHAHDPSSLIYEEVIFPGTPSAAQSQSAGSGGSGVRPSPIRMHSSSCLIPPSVSGSGAAAASSRSPPGCTVRPRNPSFSSSSGSVFVAANSDNAQNPILHVDR